MCTAPPEHSCFTHLQTPPKTPPVPQSRAPRLGQTSQPATVPSTTVIVATRWSRTSGSPVRFPQLHLAANTVSSPNFDRKHSVMQPEPLEDSPEHPCTHLKEGVHTGGNDHLPRGGFLFIFEIRKWLNCETGTSSRVNITISWLLSLRQHRHRSNNLFVWVLFCFSK